MFGYQPVIPLLIIHGNTIQLLVIPVAISTVYIFTYSFHIRYWVNDGTKYQMLSRLPIYGVIISYESSRL